MALKKLEYFSLPGSLPSESTGRKVTATPLRCIRSVKEVQAVSRLRLMGTRGSPRGAFTAGADRPPVGGLRRLAARGAGLASGQSLEQHLHVRKGDVLGCLRTWEDKEQARERPSAGARARFSQRRPERMKTTFISSSNQKARLHLDVLPVLFLQQTLVVGFDAERQVRARHDVSPVTSESHFVPALSGQNQRLIGMMAPMNGGSADMKSPGRTLSVTARLGWAFGTHPPAFRTPNRAPSIAHTRAC